MNRINDRLDVLLDELADRIAERLAPRSGRSDFVCEDELVALLGSREKAKRLIKSGEIAGSVVGRRLVAERDSLSAFLRSMRPTQGAPVEETKAERVARAVEAAGLRVVSGSRR